MTCDHIMPGSRLDNPRPLRILHYYPTSWRTMTGVETFILHLCEAQRLLGMAPRICTPFDGRAELVDLARGMDVPIFDTPTRNAFENAVPRKLGTALFRARLIRTLAVLLRDADVLHVHSVRCAGVDGVLAAFAARTRAIIVIHHTTMEWFEHDLSRREAIAFWIEKHIASQIVMPYASAAQELLSRGLFEQQVSVVPFCVDETRFSGSVTAPKPGELRLVIAARLYPGKGHRELIEAVAVLSPRYPGLRLTCLGDGPEQQAIESDIARRGLQGVVTLKGRVAFHDMPGLLRGEHVIVLPSYMSGETFPLSLLEGGAMGLPAIGARWYGIPDIIVDGETGIVVEPRDVMGLVAAIERFLVDPHLLPRMSRNVTRRVQEHFTATVVAQQYSALYSAALDRRGQRRNDP